MSSSSFATPLMALSAVALDLETTGLDARSARIVQIGAVRIEKGCICPDVRFDRLVNPGIAIPASATTIHGITDAAVSSAAGLTDLLPEIETFCGDAIIIGHTIGYDLAVLKREYERANRPWRQPQALDIRLLARLIAPTLADHSINALCKWLNVPMVGRHTAVGDAETTARLFLALVPQLRDLGIRTLAEAEAASRALSEADVRTVRAVPAPHLSLSPHHVEGVGRIDTFPYRHRVRDIMTAPPVFADARATVRDGIRLLLQQKVSSVYLTSDDGEYGIATEHDMLRAINEFGEAGLKLPLSAVMSKPLQSISEDAFVYKAIGRTNRLGFRHLGVHNAAGDIVGALTTRDLLRHDATAAIALGDEVDCAESATALGEAWAKLPAMAHSLLAEGVDARTISAIVSSEIRDITKRAAEFAEAKLLELGHGPPPCAYAVLVLGSAGRGESLLAADQDNAIVYEKGVEGGPEDRWFETLGTEMCQTLHEVGIPLCKGGVMAKNRAWRMSLADWNSTIDTWVGRQHPEDLLNVDIFFDGITVHGDSTLGQAIWNYAYDRGHSAPDFLKLLAEAARRRTPAFTLFGNFRTDQKGRIDLKKTGLMPIFTAARVLSIRHDVRERSTPGRLKGVAARGIGSEHEIGEIIEAHRTIIREMLKQQVTDAERGLPLSPRVDISQIAKSEKRKLASALGKVEAVINLVSDGRL